MFSKVRALASTAAFAAIVMLSVQSAQAATITITNWDDTSSDPSFNIIAGDDNGLLGFVGAFDMDGYPSGTATLSTTDATGYNISPNSNPSSELTKFGIVSGLTGYTALKDDSEDTLGSFQQSGSDTFAVISADYFSLKYGSYLAFFQNTSGGTLTVNMWEKDCSGDNCGTTSDRLSHVTEYISPVPVPASGLLLLGGLGGLVAMRRRKKLQKS